MSDWSSEAWMSIIVVRNFSSGDCSSLPRSGERLWRASCLMLSRSPSAAGAGALEAGESDTLPKLEVSDVLESVLIELLGATTSAVLLSEGEGTGVFDPNMPSLVGAAAGSAATAGVSVDRGVMLKGWSLDGVVTSAAGAAAGSAGSGGTPLSVGGIGAVVAAC